MDFFIKNLKETLDAINKLIEKNINITSTKRVRRCNNIKSSNRSKINFIWRSLDLLEEKGILEIDGSTSPKKYHIIPNEAIDIDKFISEIQKKR
ncbi:MAG: hypothetical protein EU547_02000 [Promethearchaeota archaeon]|nr:MAG: hypothetical protein EU547_02000 [Candidatus Lokiarchaeota archaeon]